jgi:hypothetical protein
VQVALNIQGATATEFTSLPAFFNQVGNLVTMSTTGPWSITLTSVPRFLTITNWPAALFPITHLSGLQPVFFKGASFWRAPSTVTLARPCLLDVGSNNTAVIENTDPTNQPTLQGFPLGVLSFGALSLSYNL